jgi:competence protein ComEA
MALFMLSASSSNTKEKRRRAGGTGYWPANKAELPAPPSAWRYALFTAAFVLAATSAFAQLPDGPGKAETDRICSQCHELERSISLHQDRDAWQATMNKMVSLGAKGTEKEFQAVVEYLAKNFAGEGIPKIDVNQAESIDLESGLSLKRSEAAAIIQYRTKNGSFKSIEDLKKVPGIDAAKIEAKKDRLVFK